MEPHKFYLQIFPISPLLITSVYLKIFLIYHGDYLRFYPGNFHYLWKLPHFYLKIFIVSPKDQLRFYAQTVHFVPCRLPQIFFSNIYIP